LISAALTFVVYVLAGAVAGALLGPLAVSRRTALAIAPALLTLIFRRAARVDELGISRVCKRLVAVSGPGIFPAMASRVGNAKALAPSLAIISSASRSQLSRV
jgi:hypothetical protein